MTVYDVSDDSDGHDSVSWSLHCGTMTIFRLVN